MATIATPTRKGEPFYIESDGRPLGETPRHLRNLRYLIEPLERWFASDPQVFVAGNMFVHYVPGDRNRHLSPDVFVVRGVPKDTDPERRAYLVWKEGKAPDMVIELTSASTREEDVTDKRALYQDVLRVPEYFLFDPYEEYLHPPFQGYRLMDGQYQPIEPVDGRLPSNVVGLHLEAVGELLRLYDPSADRWLETPPEVEEARERAEAGLAAEAKARREAEAEIERLRRENEELRRKLPRSS